MLLKERQKEREDDEQDISSYLMFLKKREDPGMLEQEETDHTLRRTHSGRSYGPVTKQNA
jgi:hypothetical protein